MKKQKESIILFSLIFVILMLLNFSLLLLSLRSQISLKIGEPAPQDVILPITVSYVDEEKTELAKKNAAKGVSPLYTFDSSVKLEIINDLEEFFNESIKVKSAETGKDEKLNKLVNDLKVDNQTATLILNEPDERLIDIKNLLVNNINFLYENGIKEENLDEIITEIKNNLEKSGFKKEEEDIAITVLKRFIKPNLVVDRLTTEKLIQEAVKNVKPVQVTIQSGTKIIEKGETVTQEDIKTLEKIGIYKQINAYNVMVLIMLSFFEGQIIFGVTKGKKFALKKSIEIITVFFIVSLLAFLLSKISIFLLPIPLFILILIEFFDFKDVVLLSLAFLLILSNMFMQEASILIIYFVFSILLAYLQEREIKILSYFKRNLYFTIIVASIVLFVSKSFIASSQNAVTNSLYALINFSVSTFSSLAVVYILEHIFNEATFLRLIELNEPNNPILKELLERAPGTFNHSLNVANIASQAADAIEANFLLTRVGALYHDIGKMLYPYYFTENQVGIPNIHNSISPSLSKVILINHVKDGIALAKRYRLPYDVIHFIETHHGKSILLYFYRKAKETNPEVSEEEFRYPGPLPDTKETFIVSLADAIEAASHSLSDNETDYRHLEEVVNRIVEERMKEGEFVEAPVTFHEIDIIKQTFVKSLFSIYHKRERYPDEKTDSPRSS